MLNLFLELRSVSVWFVPDLDADASRMVVDLSEKPGGA
jgi:hypothetical protein